MSGKQNQDKAEVIILQDEIKRLKKKEKIGLIDFKKLVVARNHIKTLEQQIKHLQELLVNPMNDTIKNLLNTIKIKDIKIQSLEAKVAALNEMVNQKFNDKPTAEEIEELKREKFYKILKDQVAGLQKNNKKLTKTNIDLRNELVSLKLKQQQ